VRNFRKKGELEKLWEHFYHTYSVKPFYFLYKRIMLKLFFIYILYLFFISSYYYLACIYMKRDYFYYFVRNYEKEII